MLTVELVKEKVADIFACAHDDEQAHVKEDRLWQEVLEAIAEGHPESQRLAVEALKTTAIIFSRWCA